MEVGEMSVIDLASWVAGALVLATFYLKTIIPLRTVAIASNVAFVGYGLLAGLTPIVVLHTLLLPLNILRLYQLRALVHRVKRASRGDFTLEMLIPHMKRQHLRSGTLLFAKGDDADTVYLVLEGRIRILGANALIRPGQLVGEMGLFAPDRLRTDSAVCETDAEVSSVTEDQLWELFYQNPEFGAYLLRIIVQRAVAGSLAADHHEISGRAQTMDTERPVVH